MIEITCDAAGFILSYKGRQFLRHSARRPALAVGRGEGHYGMAHGNFRIRDRVREKTPCAAAQVAEASPSRAVIEFPGLLRMVWEVREGRLHGSLEPARSDVNRLWIDLCATPNERIWGCGEQHSTLDLRGRHLPVWSQEQGVGRGFDLITLLANIESSSGGRWYSGYFPMPTIVSSANWFCHVASSAYAHFDFRSPTLHRLHFWEVPSAIVLDCAPSAPEVVGSLSSLLGRQPPPPEWAEDGVFLGVQGGSAVVRARLQAALDAGVRVAGLWVQDWVGRRLTSFGSQLMWNWRFDEERYPDLPALIQECHSRGIRFLGYINPFLAVERELYREASELGLCVRNERGKDFLVTTTDFPAALLDLTNPQAREWIKRVIRENMIGIGMDGWMADYGEYLPPGTVLHSGESWELVHNLYPALWARVNAEAVREAGREKEIFFFMRAGYTGSSSFAPGIWAGDQLVNWSMTDGLGTVIPAGISLGLQGIGHFHSDIGGFTTVRWIRRSKELFGRWAELAAFSPMMRSHEGNRPERNWQFHSDAQTLRHLAGMTEVFRMLKDYRREALREYRDAGLPLIRHPWLHYEADQVLGRLRYQYLLGRDLMVAPVIRRGARWWRAYLPHDRWVHLWTGERAEPGWVRVSSPLGHPPVFYREGSPFVELFRRLRAF